MAKPSYYELLKHPNWQKKRLQIMNRAEFKCDICQSDDQTLNVHHGYYEKGVMPWDYPDNTLWCLCESCHKGAQRGLLVMHREIGRMWPLNVGIVIGFLRGLRTRFGVAEQEIPIEGGRVIKGLAAFFGISDQRLRECIGDRKSILVGELRQIRDDVESARMEASVELERLRREVQQLRLAGDRANPAQSPDSWMIDKWG